MPFQSEEQRRFMHARHPQIAKRWEKEYGKVPQAKSNKSASTAFKAAIRRRMAGRTKGARPFQASSVARRRTPLKSMPSGRLVKSPGQPGSPTRSIPGQLSGAQATPIQVAARRRLQGRAMARQMPVARKK